MKLDLSYSFSKRALGTFWLPVATISFFLLFIPFIVDCIFHSGSINITKCIYFVVMSVVLFNRSQEFWIHNKKRKMILDIIMSPIIWIISVPVFIMIAIMVGIMIVVIWCNRKNKKDPKLLYVMTYWLASMMLFTFGIRLKVKGNLPKNGQYIITPNHSAFIDEGFVGIIAELKPFRVVFAKEIQRTPFVKFFARRFGIPIERGNIESKRKTTWAVSGEIGNGFNIIIFPEGSMLRPWEIEKGLRDFLLGPFLLAIKNNIPIIPVINDWPTEFKPRSEKFWGKPWWWSPRTITTYYLEPVYPEGKTAEQLMEEVREKMLKKLRNLREVVR